MTESEHKLLLQAEQSLLRMRQNLRAVTSELTVYTYYEIGHMLWELEQGSQPDNDSPRLSKLWSGLSAALAAKHGPGFSVTNLKQMKRFYEVYAPSRLRSTLQRFLNDDEVRAGAWESLRAESRQEKTLLYGTMAGYPLELRDLGFCLSWSHYLILMRLSEAGERDFYEQQAVAQGWSTSVLKAKIAQDLYHKDSTIAPKQIEPKQIAPNNAQGSLALLQNNDRDKYLRLLAQALLEPRWCNALLGSSQKYGSAQSPFVIDLVLYNRLRCGFILLALKCTKWEASDRVRLQSYADYFDREHKLSHEKPTLVLMVSPALDKVQVELLSGDSSQEECPALNVGELCSSLSEAMNNFVLNS